MGFRLKDLDSSKEVELKSGDILGRSEGHHQFPQADKMSRSHCQFLLDRNIPFILDLNSRNGTYVNSVKIEPHKKTLLNDGHILMFGERTFVFKTDERTPSQIIPGVSAGHEASGKFATPVRTYDFSFKASNAEFFMLLLKNVLFTLLTLGFYIPYARINLRRFVWKSSSLNNFPFLFKGNPSSLLKSYAILLGLFILLSMINQAITMFVVQGSISLTFVHSIVSSAAIFMLFLWARYGAYSYLVNNTSYRSVFFKVNKKGSKAHFKSSVYGAFLTLFTLGIFYPFMAATLEKHRWNNTQYGNVGFKLDMENGDYARNWFKGFFLTLFTLGFYYPWFAVSMHHFRMRHLKMAGAKVISKAQGGGYFWVLAKSIFLMMITLGLAAPFVQNLNLSYFLKNLSPKGSINFDEIVAVAKSDKGTFSDSVADVLDLEVDLG